MPVPARWRLAVLVSIVVLAAACAAPPTKELSLAEGAIDAARAAGAAEYATDDLAAAEQLLTRARAEVADRDYRAALGHALDANVRAQAAVRAAGDGRLRARLAADETLDLFAALIERVETRLASDEAKRVPAPSRRRAQGAVTRALEVLATTRAAVERGELGALAAVGPETTALEAALTGLAPPAPTRPRARR